MQWCLEPAASGSRVKHSTTEPLRTLLCNDGHHNVAYIYGKILRFAHQKTSILLKEPFALKNSETVYFTSIFSTPSYSDIVPIDNFDLTFFYFYFVFEVFDTIQF